MEKRIRVKRAMRDHHLHYGTTSTSISNIMDGGGRSRCCWVLLVVYEYDMIKILIQKYELDASMCFPSPRQSVPRQSVKIILIARREHDEQKVTLTNY